MLTDFWKHKKQNTNFYKILFKIYLYKLVKLISTKESWLEHKMAGKCNGEVTEVFKGMSTFRTCTPGLKQVWPDGLEPKTRGERQECKMEQCASSLQQKVLPN